MLTARKLGRFTFAQALLSLGLLICAQQAAFAEKVLRFPFPIEETGFDPVMITDLYSRSVTANIFDAPMRYKWMGKDQVEPNVVDSVPEMSADYKTFTFHLKKGIYFAPDAAFNGKKRELVADDFVYSMKRVYDPRWKSPNYQQLATYKIASLEKLREDAIKNGHFDYETPVDGIKALDRYTWQVTVGVPSPRFVTEIYADGSNLGVMAREVVEKYADNVTAHPVGTGPYMLEDWVHSSKIVLVKNPNYRTDIFHVDPNADYPEAKEAAALYNGKQMPFVDRIEISIIDESQPRWLSFLNAEQDISWPVPPDIVSLAFPNNKLAPNLAKKHLKYWRVVDMRQFLFFFNMEDKLVGGYTPDKVALRRAIGLGLNAPGIIANVYRYQGTPASSLIVPGQYGASPGQRSEMAEYDPAKANAILDTYGYLPRPGDKWRNLPDGTPFTIIYNTNPTQIYRSIDEIFKKSFDAMGIRIQFNTAIWPQLLQEAQQGTFQTWYLGLSAATVDPTDGLQLGYGPAKGGGNLSRFDLPEYNALYEKSSSIPDGPERLALIGKMNAIMNAYMPYKFLFNPDSVYMAYPWVLGWYRDPLMQDWYRYVDIDASKQAPYLNRAS
jgi:ABC-type transport system substrate-binding protein